MSLRFAIRNTPGKAEKEGDGTIVRYSGTSEPFFRVSERYAKKVGMEGKDDPRLQFVTGLDEKRVDFYSWYSDEEKKEVKKQIKELKPQIEALYGGAEVIADTNKYFWLGNDVSRLSLTNEDIDVFYDTKSPVHALLYLSIIAGAFSDTVGPTKNWAEEHQLPHYLALEQEANSLDDEDEDVLKSDAHAALSNLKKNSDPEALFILAWCLQYDTNAYGAHLRSTPFKDLVNYHIKYIDGKLQLKKKRQTPKVFLEYAERWEGQQTRPKLYAEAYIKAGEYFNFIQQRDRKFTTVEGTSLGNSIQEAVDNIVKPKFNQELELLRERVEEKWKE